ncbi:MAG TPA: wax ester/triacylglycerol synthase family O-acyltransferase [Frankiaceae bacterium]|jgi:WS/DGAT/MGAT family acyltransferase|nr:wax ester/triacylglycerol synthase family O-acyltransferase [Frankiaceae bacterium]
MPTLMSPTSSLFLVPESRDQPMHVGGLQLFRPPDGAGPDYLGDLYREALTHADDVAPLFRRRPYRGWRTAGQWAWEDEADIDLEHHIRHSALPRPGRVRELLALASRLHSSLLDRHHPLWETHLIEGLEDGRFAVYSKIHHSLIDGVSALRLLERTLSTDPDDRDVPMPFSSRMHRKRRREDGDGENLASKVAKAGASAITDAVGLTPRLLKLAYEAFGDGGAVVPGQAPRSMLNVPITGSRRFAADAWDLRRMKDVGRAADATLNDVVLAMSSGALRQYLLSQDALPDAPLVAMTPVSLRGDDDDETGSVSVGAILVSLATDVADPAERLLAIRRSARDAKAAMAGLSQLQATALSAAMMAPLLLEQTPVSGLVRPAFNIVISNIPGPKDPLYWNGARLDGMYPLSIPINGQALNITVTSYAGRAQFGLTGCRRTLPHMQRLLNGLEESLAALEKAFL